MTSISQAKMDQLEDMLALVAKYRARLEIDHHYELKDGQMVRVDRPIGVDLSVDKIDCLEVELAEWREVTSPKNRQAIIRALIDHTFVVLSCGDVGDLADHESSTARKLATRFEEALFAPRFVTGS